MVVIRLARIGKKNHPTYRIIVSDRQKDTVGTYLEQLGTFDPHQNPATILLKEDRVKHWLSVGAQPSDSVHNLLVEKGVLPGPKRVIAVAKKEEVPADLPAGRQEAAPAAATPVAAETPAAEPAA
jgi:small subunit ribosomal protein S16